MTTIPDLLCQLERDAHALDAELALDHPAMKRPEVNVILQAVRQVQDRLTRERRLGPPPRAPLQADPTSCAGRRYFRTVAEAGRIARQHGRHRARVVACAGCGMFHLEDASPEASAETEAA
jgi:hypothetical protein